MREALGTAWEITAAFVVMLVLVGIPGALLVSLLFTIAN